MSFNKITIMGNLGRDPELRYTPQGDAVCNFSVAVSEKKRDKAGELQEITNWFRVTLWRKQAENASKYLTKGSPIYIEGRLSVDEWTDRDGKTRFTLEVSATDMHFVGRAGGQDSSETSNSHSSSNNEYSGSSDSGSSTTFEPVQSAASDDDIPF